MTTVIGQILAPIRYLRITRGPKILIDVALPIMFGSLATAAILSMPSGFPITGQSGLVAGMNSALQVLVGFYVAALAAVSTFNSVSLDQDLADGMRLPGAGRVATRREMLSYLFGYLSFLSFGILLVGLFATPIAFAIGRLTPQHLIRIVRGVCLEMYTICIFSLFFTTLLGLYYLVDRSQRADPTPVSGAGVTQIGSGKPLRPRPRKRASPH
jgi:hypothetical protein